MRSIGLVLLLAATQIGGCERYGGGRKPAFGLNLASPEFDGPRVLSTSPVPGATGIPISAKILIAFSEPMNPDTLVFPAVSLTHVASGVSVAASLSYAPSSSALTLTPSGFLQTSTSYQIRVATSVSAANGRPLVAPLDSTFATGVSADAVPPVFAGAQSSVAENARAILVTWSPASDNSDPAGALVYHVYAATSPGGQNFSSPTATTAPGATSQVLSTLNPSTSYFIVVRAQDTSGNRDSNAVQVSSTTPFPRSWLTDVWSSILSPRCSSCHSSGSGANVLIMSSPVTAYSNLYQVTATKCSPKKRVAPFNSVSSVLYLKVIGIACGDRMPEDGPPYLTTAQIETVKDWIDEGAPNN